MTTICRIIGCSQLARIAAGYAELYRLAYANDFEALPDVLEPLMAALTVR